MGLGKALYRLVLLPGLPASLYFEMLKGHVVVGWRVGLQKDLEIARFFEHVVNTFNKQVSQLKTELHMATLMLKNT